MEYIGAYLRAPFDLLLGGIGGVLHFFLLAQLFLVQAAFEHFERLFPVLSLGTGLLAFYDDTAGLVFEPDGRLHLVHILTSLTAAAIKFPFQVGRADLDLDTVVNQGVDEYGGKRSM